MVEWLIETTQITHVILDLLFTIRQKNIEL